MKFQRAIAVQPRGVGIHCPLHFWDQRYNENDVTGEYTALLQ
jgi:hypothetical protein